MLRNENARVRPPRDQHPRIRVAANEQESCFGHPQEKRPPWGVPKGIRLKRRQLAPHNPTRPRATRPFRNLLLSILDVATAAPASLVTCRRARRVVWRSRFPGTAAAPSDNDVQHPFQSVRQIRMCIDHIVRLDRVTVQVVKLTPIFCQE